MFLDCGEAWRRKYVAQEPTGSSPALLFGSAWHNALETHLRTRFTINEPGSQALTGMLLDAWQAAWNEQVEANASLVWDDTPESYCNDGARLLSNIDVQKAICNIRVATDEQGLQIERKVELRVPGVPVPIIGYIDVILEDGVPADLKTAARSWSDDKAQDSLQGLFYLAALNQAGINVPDWRFRHIVFVKTKTPQVQILDHTHNPGELLFLFNLIQRVWHAIEAGAFVINPTGWRCSPRYCDFYHGCRGKFNPQTPTL